MNLYTYPQNSSCTYNMLARESLSKETAEYISKSDYPLPLLFMTSRLEMHHLVVIFDNDLFHFESWTNQTVSFITVMVFYSAYHDIIYTLQCPVNQRWLSQSNACQNLTKRKRNWRGRGLMLLDRWNMPTANAYNQYKA